MLQGLIILCGLVIILYLVQHCFYLWQQLLVTRQQLQSQQQLIEQTFINIHNGPLQLLIFLIREIQIHELSQQETLNYLNNVYQDVLVNMQNLEEKK
jgi:hypothetical protein